MINEVKLSTSEKFLKLHCTYTDTKPFILLKAFVPICLPVARTYYMYIMFDTYTVSQKKTRHQTQLQIFKSTPVENYEMLIYQAKLSVSSTTTGFM